LSHEHRESVAHMLHGASADQARRSPDANGPFDLARSPRGGAPGQGASGYARDLLYASYVSYVPEACASPDSRLTDWLLMCPRSAQPSGAAPSVDRCLTDA